VRHSLRPASFSPSNAAGWSLHAQMAVDIDQRGAVGFLPHHVGIPEFVVKSLRAHNISLADTRFRSARLCHNHGRLAAYMGGIGVNQKVGKLLLAHTGHENRAI